MDAQKKGHVKTQQEYGQPQAKERSLRKNQTCWHLNLGLLTSRTVKSNFLLFKTPSLWNFVMAACCAVPHSPAPTQLCKERTQSQWQRHWWFVAGYHISQRQKSWSNTPHPATYGCTANGRQDTAAIFALQRPGGGGYKLERAWCQKSSFIARAAKARTALFLLMAKYTGPFWSQS